VSEILAGADLDCRNLREVGLVVQQRKLRANVVFFWSGPKFTGAFQMFEALFEGLAQPMTIVACVLEPPSRWRAALRSLRDGVLNLL